jgi:dTDP-glucose 4,6-dehydratase
VLVTGAGGFVGSHVVEELLARTDWHVVGVDSFRHSGELDKLVAATRHDPTRVTALVHDLNVPFTNHRVLELDGLPLDYVVNVASRSHVDESVREPDEFVLNNVRLMLTVLELCRLVEPRRLVHVSTDEVHGASGTSVEHRPSSPYAASKAAQVDLAHAYARTYGVRTTVVTSANMFGERQMTTAYVPLVVRALVTGTTLDVHHHAGRPGERSYTYVKNVAARLVDELLTIDVDDADVTPTLRHVALPGQRRVDNVTLALDVALAASLPLRWRAVDADERRPGYDPTYATLDGTWNPVVDFDHGLYRTVRWYLNELEVARS